MPDATVSTGIDVTDFATPIRRQEDWVSLADNLDKKPKASSVTDSRPAGQRPADPQMGQALRSVYQKTVEEAVPDEMLALLSKLD